MTQRTGFRCQDCSMEFQNENAWNQHNQARHQMRGADRGSGWEPGGSGEHGMWGQGQSGGEPVTPVQTRTAGNMGSLGGQSARTMGGGSVTQAGIWRCEGCGSDFRSRSEWEDHSRIAHR